MQIFTSDKPLEWGALDLPLLGIASDWAGNSLCPPAAFTLASNRETLWFVATRQAPAATHPGAEPGAFTAELWKHDVSELFIATPDGSRYLEFNLAANGAWWACAFDSVRNASDFQPDFSSAVASFHDEVQNDSWLAALAIPVAFLQEQIGFGNGSRANVAFIMNSPQQTFHSASKLPGDVPDFHQPAAFPPIVFIKTPER